MTLFNDSEISRKELRKLVDFLPYPIIVWDRKPSLDKCLFYNKKFSSQIGYSLKEAPCKDALLELLYPQGEYRSVVLTSWKSRRRRLKEASRNL
ncbi:PAS domain-containing protein [Flavobacterium gelatinilyticum]|uniref:PAS domain-containing protein n=1 Tax=Flavobacterium gelatinilyticum TaxID=3003260 RepID=UPI003D7AEE9C